jgi:hypothetical protein
VGHCDYAICMSLRPGVFKIFKLTFYADNLPVWLSVAADPTRYMTRRPWMSKTTSIAWVQITIRTCTSIWTSWVTLSLPRSSRRLSCNLISVKRREAEVLTLTVSGIVLQRHLSGFGGLGVVCWPLVPKFAGSNPAGAVGFLRGKKPSARLPSEGK